MALNNKQKITLFNGVIYPVSSFETVPALVIEKGTIIFLGESLTAKLVGEGGDFIDLKGKVVLPGFVDSHVHLVMSALKGQEIDLSSATSPQEILTEVKEKAKDSKCRVVLGWGMDPSRFGEVLPTLEELDEASPHKPVLITRRDGHSAITNSKGLITIGKVASNSNASLLVREEYSQAISKFYSEFSVNDIAEPLKKFSTSIVKKGVTFVHALEGGFTSPSVSIDAFFKNPEKSPHENNPLLPDHQHKRGRGAGTQEDRGLLTGGWFLQLPYRLFKGALR